MDFLLKKIDESWDTPTELDEKMNALKRKMEQLNALKEDMESRRSKGLLHRRKKLKKEVELWFKNVKSMNSKIQVLEQKMGESSNVVARGLFRGNVFKKIQEVEELFQQGKSHDSLVVDNPGWIGQALPTTTLIGDAARTCKEEICGYLMGADVQKIGVWGMGGIGKTAIMKQVHNQLLNEKERFDIVIWVSLSNEMNIIKLQDRIAREIKVKLYEHEDEAIRAGQIREMLDRKGKYVLVLDDLWDKLSLEEVGIPEPSNGSKLLVTTRLLDVCHYLDCRAVKMRTLSKPDAWRLFLEKVGQDVSKHSDLLPIVESVAEECDGLPLAIVTIASSMKGVEDVHEWRNALHELKRHVKSVNEMKNKVFRQLRFSYDRLGDEKVKHCFLCCALYPEDFEIDADELIKLWIAEGLVEEMESMQIEIDRGRTILNKLKNSCLIENAPIREDRVKLHDVIRDMAIRITSEKPRFLVRAGMQLKEISDVQDWNEDLEKGSLMDNRELQIPSQLPPPKCPKLTTLLLSGCNIRSIPECFFEQMSGLKILDLSHNFGIKSLPNSFSNLETLTTLLLGYCWALKTVPSFSKFQALKKLDLGGTSIKEIPHGMERLANLKYLDLSWTQITEKADGILGKLSSLQHLAVFCIGEFVFEVEEICGLKKLESLDVQFNNLKEFKSYVEALLAQKRGPPRYDICVGNDKDETDYIMDRTVIQLNGCHIMCTDNDIKVPSDVEELWIANCICSVDLCEERAFLSRFIPTLNMFSSLSAITIRKCKNIKTLFSSKWVLHNLQNLEDLTVEGCGEMEEIIASESESEEEGTIGVKITLPKLCLLRLKDLSELKSICGANREMVCDSIQCISIKNCPKLKRIPLNLPLQDDGQPSPHPSLNGIIVSSKEWWELVEWDHPNAKSLLEPLVHISDIST